MTSQALSQDLRHVSERLECLEDQVQRSSGEGQTLGVTMEELEEERDALKKKRDKLDAQLKDNKVLTVEVRTKRTLCVCVEKVFYEMFRPYFVIVLFLFINPQPFLFVHFVCELI